MTEAREGGGLELELEEVHQMAGQVMGVGGPSHSTILSPLHSDVALPRHRNAGLIPG
jgi:hypothetical protein